MSKFISLNKLNFYCFSNDLFIDRMSEKKIRIFKKLMKCLGLKQIVHFSKNDEDGLFNFCLNRA